MDVKIPDNLLYTKDHEWMSVDDSGIATMGLTDYAQDQLEDIVYLDLPEVGTNVSSGEAFGSVEAVKAVEDIFAPVSGEIVEVNAKLEDQPELCNQDPYGEGWLVKINMADKSEADSLLPADKYRELLH